MLHCSGIQSRGVFMNFKILGCIICCATCFCLSGCDDGLSGDSYTHAQAKAVNTVQYGTIVSMREVSIKRHEGPGMGAGLGAAGGGTAGYLIGNAVSNSTTGKLVGAGIGALAGGIAGNAIQNRSTKGFEYTVQLDNGGTVAIAQGKTPAMSIGQRVQVISGSSGGRVVPA